MNVLIDNHHTELTYSLELLFGKRLGAKVYYPIGREWFEQGYWKVFPHPETVEQYLGMHQADASAHQKNEIMTGSGPEAPEPGVHYVKASTKPHYERAITFREFLKKPFDLVVASIPAHVPAFGEMIRRHKPRAKLIFQIGNMFPGSSLKGAKNVMNSTEHRLPFFTHKVNYSQEFDLETFRFSPPPLSRRISNFTHYMAGADFFASVRERLPEFTFESYGSGNQNGTLTGTALVAEKMRAADFIWNLKGEGDGYGHVVHNAAALGRPLIISKAHYRGMRFAKFIEDGVTCVTVDGLSAPRLAEKIRFYSEPALLTKMGRALYERFLRYVDFDRDEKNVRRFLGRLR